MLSLSSWLDSSLLTGVVGVLSVLYLAWTRYRMFLEQKKPFGDALPMPPNSHWLLGHVPKMRGDFRTSYQYLTREHCNEYGQTGYWLISRKSVSVTDYQDARTVLNNSTDKKFMKIFSRHFDQFVGPRTTSRLNGKEWKVRRTIITRAFAPAAVSEAQAEILKVMSTFLASLKTLDEKLPIQRDIGALMKMITIDVFGQTALSRDLGCCSKLLPSPLAIAFDYMSEELSRRLYSSPFALCEQLYWIPTERNLRYKRERKLIRDVLEDAVRERVSMPHDNRPRDLLTQLLQGVKDNSNNESDALPEKALSDALTGLLFAGYDTTSLTLTYALYIIATTPEVERRCLEETERADSTDPDSLQYCKAVLLETLRLYPPAPATGRSIEKPITLKGGTVVPAGASCSIPIWTIQRMEEHFERPDEFHPERWARQDKNGVWNERSEDDAAADGIAPANRKAFFAFSAGARSCPGMKFAMTEAVLVFSQLVKHLSFELQPDYELCPVRFGILQHPRDDMVMTIKWRDE